PLHRARRADAPGAKRPPPWAHPPRRARAPAVRATSKPNPPATPAPASTDKMNFKLAQSLEQQERYDEAIKIYEDYFARNATAPDAKVVASYLNELRKMQLALTLADSAM